MTAGFLPWGPPSGPLRRFKVPRSKIHKWNPVLKNTARLEVQHLHQVSCCHLIPQLKLNKCAKIKNVGVNRGHVLV